MKKSLDFSRYKFYLTHEPELEQDRVELYSKVYENYIEQLTRDFRNDQDWYKFYRSLHYFIYQISINFGLTRLSNFILYNYNQERIEYLKNIKHLSS